MLPCNLKPLVLHLYWFLVKKSPTVLCLVPPYFIALFSIYFGTKRTDITEYWRVLLLGVSFISTAAYADAFEIDFKNGDKMKFGGYLKADARYVSGDLNYQDYWIGNNPSAVDTSKLGLNIKESPINIPYTHGDWTGFIEMVFLWRWR